MAEELRRLRSIEARKIVNAALDQGVLDPDTPIRRILQMGIDLEPELAAYIIAWEGYVWIVADKTGDVGSIRSW